MHCDLRSSTTGMLASADFERPLRPAELFLRRLNGELRPPCEWEDTVSNDSEEGLQMF